MQKVSDIISMPRSIPKSVWEDIMKRKVEVKCPHCAEIFEELLVSRNFEGNIKCPTCNELFFVKIENFEVEVTDIKKHNG
jgi:phage FluMu protein Com